MFACSPVRLRPQLSNRDCSPGHARRAALAALAGVTRALSSCAGGSGSRAFRDAPSLRIEPGPAVLRVDFPDPFVLAVDGGHLAYATNNVERAINVQMASSRDLAVWELSARDAMPTLPGWAKTGFTWAPEVLAVDGGFVLYFTARHLARDLQCVGAATSADPRGPFTSLSKEPLVCQFEIGGTIDASPFRDTDGQLYLYFKNDGNHPDFRQPTRIWGQRLASDGLRLLGEPVALLRNDAAWEGDVVEAPTMMLQGAGYRLLFSANDYGWPALARTSPYAIGYAGCAGPLGPCRDAPDNPVLASRTIDGGGCLSGPGHQAAIEGEPAIMVFHAWDATADCRPATRRRFMHVGRLRAGDAR